MFQMDISGQHNRGCLCSLVTLFDEVIQIFRSPSTNKQNAVGLNISSSY